MRFPSRPWIQDYLLVFLAALAFGAGSTAHSASGAEENARPANNDEELEYWLTNMVSYHRFETSEVQAATGLSEAEISAELARLKIRPGDWPKGRQDTLVVLPYPGGRHPRKGFLEGAIRPQRETKVSVFTPWDPASYVVVDVPEAIWSNLGLTYLAHTHIPTVWTKRGQELDKLEWKRGEAGRLDARRRLPNGIVFSVEIRPRKDHVRMRMSLTNGTDAKLTDLRVQNCVMFKSAAGFAAQTKDNKRLARPYVACHDEEGQRWVITAWEPCHRVWQNPPCPCIHSDPRFPDCAPGETKYVRGWLSFYQGQDIQAELRRIDALGWRDDDWEE